MSISSRRAAVALSAPALLAFSPLAAVPCQAQGFSLGDAANYAVLVEPSLHNNFNLSSTSGVTGNVGIGSPINSVNLSGGTITGNVDFLGALPSRSPSPPNFNGTVTERSNRLPAAPTRSPSPPNFNGTVTGMVTTDVKAVSMALSTVNSLNSTLGSERGTSLMIKGNGQVINATSGKLDAHGNYVFKVATASDFNNNRGGITIKGTASQYVVINIHNGTGNVSLDGPISLRGGITSDHVLFNFVGTSGELGGAANGSVAMGTFLAPHMEVHLNSVIIDGRVFGGGSSTSNNDFIITSGAYVNAPDSPPVVPEPSSGVVAAFVAAIALGWAGVRRLRHRSARPLAP